MTKIIRMISNYEKERDHNIKALKNLVDKYKVPNKNRIINKIKKEQ